jgi:hypothetical protein
MGKYLRISSNIRKPFLIYDCSTLNLFIYEENLIFFFVSVVILPLFVQSGQVGAQMAAAAAAAGGGAS